MRTNRLIVCLLIIIIRSFDMFVCLASLNFLTFCSDSHNRYGAMVSESTILNHRIYCYGCGTLVPESGVQFCSQLRLLDYETRSGAGSAAVSAVTRHYTLYSPSSPTRSISCTQTHSDCRHDRTDVLTTHTQILTLELAYYLIQQSFW